MSGLVALELDLVSGLLAVMHKYLCYFILGHSTSAWCQLGNGLRIVNGGSGQWKRLRSSRWGMLLMMMIYIL